MLDVADGCVSFAVQLEISYTHESITVYSLTDAELHDSNGYNNIFTRTLFDYSFHISVIVMMLFIQVMQP